MVSTLVVFLSLGVVELETVMAALLPSLMEMLFLNQTIVGSGMLDARQIN